MKAQSLNYDALYNVLSPTPQLQGSVDLSAQDDSMGGVTFNNDGTKMYVVGVSTSSIYQYTLTTAYDATSGSVLDGFYDVGAYEIFPQSLTFNDTGTKFFIVGTNSIEVHQYSLTTPYDLSNTVNVTFNGSFSVQSEVPVPRSITFGFGGNKLFVSGSDVSQVSEYLLLTAYDITNAAHVRYNGSTMNVNVFESGVQGITFNDTGTLLYVVGASGAVHQFSLASAYGISSGVTFVGSFNISLNVSDPSGLQFDASGSRLLVTDLMSGTVTQYTVGSQGFSETSPNIGAVAGSLSISITGDTFTNSGNALSSGTDYNITNLPAGLVPTLTVNSGGTFANLVLTGSATSSQNINDIADLIFTFENSAFTNTLAANVSNAISTNSGLGVDFNDNNSPVVSSALADLSLNTGFNTQDVDLSSVFTDADGHALTVTASSDDTNIGTVSISGNILTISEVGEGVCNISVTADDGQGGMVIDMFTVTIINLSLTYGDGVFEIVSSTPTFDNAQLTNVGLIARGMTFSADGSKAYVAQASSVRQFTLTEPYELSSYTDNGEVNFTSHISINLNFAVITGIAFSGDGTTLFLTDLVNDRVWILTLSNPFDIFSTVVSVFSYSTSSYGSIVGDIEFNHDGTKMFLAGNAIHQFTLSAPYSLSLLTYDGSFSGSATGIAFNTTGTKMYLSGSNIVNQYTLDVPGNILNPSTVHLDGTFTSTEAPIIEDIGFDPIGNRMFLLGGPSNKNVLQYVVANQGFQETTTNTGLVSGSLSIDLTNDTFTNAGGTLNLGTDYSIANVPSGLTPSISVAANGMSATLSLAGTAINRENVDDITSLQFTFGNSSFTNYQAASITNAVNASSGFGINFFDNNIPVVDNPIPDLELAPGFTTHVIDLTNVFSDQDVQTLTLGAISSNTNVITLSLSGNILTINEVALGNSTITVSANDGQGGVAMDEFVVSIITGRLTYHTGFDVTSNPQFQNLLDIRIQTDSPTGISFDPSGFRMYVVSHGVRAIIQYTLTTAFDVTTATHTSTFNTITAEQAPSGVTFNSDGTRMFVIGWVTRTIYQYNLSSPYDLSTGAVYSNNSFNVSSQDPVPTGMSFSSDGLHLFISGEINDNIYQYSLASPFDLSSTISYQGSFDISPQEIYIKDVQFNPEGTRMQIIGPSSKSLHQYILNIPFDITSGVVLESSFDVSSQDGDQQGFIFNTQGDKLFIVGAQFNNILQYDVPESLVEIEATNIGEVAGHPLITLTGDTFINAGSTLTAGTDYAINNLPSGLTPTISVTSGGQIATLSMTGNAVSNQNSDDLTNLSITFNNSAFTNSTAAAILNSVNANTNIDINFFDNNPPTIASALPDLTLNEGFGTHSLSMTGVFTDIDDQTLTYSAVVANSGIATVGVTGDVLTITEVSTSGTTITITANDGQGGMIGDTFALTITPAPPAISYGEFFFEAVPNVTNLINSFSVSSQDGDPESITFNNDGTKMYVLGEGSKRVHQYSLSVPFDLNGSVSLESNFFVGSQENSPKGMAFNGDGSRLFITGRVQDQVQQYLLGIPFDVTSAVHVGSFNIQPQESSSEGIAFSPDGLRMYIIGGQHKVFQYQLGSAFDVTATVSYQGELNISQEAFTRDIFFNPTGTKMFIAGANAKAIHQYSLAVPFDITNSTSVTYDYNPALNINAQDGSISGLTFTPSGNQVFIIGRSNDSVHQYNVGPGGFTEANTNDGSVNGTITLNLVGDTFSHAGSTLTNSTDYTISNLSPGLSPNVSVAVDGKSAVLTLTGQATNREAADNVSNLIFNFENSAFVVNNAASVAGAINTGSGFNISFSDNNLPVVANPLPDLSIADLYVTEDVDLSGTFSDPDVQTLTFTAISSNPSIATVGVSGNTLTITEVAVGSTTITITANDGQGGTVNDDFLFTSVPCTSISTSSIVGTTGVCINSSESYSVTGLGSNDFTWTLTGGGVFNENGGTSYTATGDMDVTVNWGSVGGAFEVSVTEISSCRNGTPQISAINISPLPTSDFPVTGSINVETGATGQVYSVVNNTDYSYSWSTSDGTIVGPNNVNSVNVNWTGTGTGTLDLNLVYIDPLDVCPNPNPSIPTIQTAIGFYDNFIFTGNGSFTTPSNWNCNCVPGSGFDIMVNGTVNLMDNSTVVDDLTINGTLNNNGFDITINGNYQLDGIQSGSGNTSLVGTNTTLSGSGTKSAGTLSLLNQNKSITNGSNLTLGGNTIIGASVNVTNNGTVNLTGLLTGNDNASSILTNGANATLNVSGATVLSTGSLIANATGNTVNYLFAGDQSIKSPDGLPAAYYNLTLDGSGNKDISSNLVITNNLSLTAGNFRATSYQVDVGGNWIENGGSFIPGTSTINFNGTAAQQIQSAAGAQSFYSLEVDNSASGNVLSLGSGVDVTISNELVLTDGLILTSATEQLILDGANVSGSFQAQNPISYINGPLTHRISGTNPSALVFPIGKGLFHQVHLENIVQGGASADYTVEFHAMNVNTLPLNSNTSFGSNTSDIKSGGLSNIGYWDRTRTGTDAFTSANLRLFYTTSDVVDDFANLTIVHANDINDAGGWTNLLPTGYGGSQHLEGSIVAPISSFSIDALGNNGQGNSSLPVELITFEATTKGSIALLHWTTATEINNDFFEIQKSSNGTDFFPIGTIQGNGDSNDVIDYQFTDKDPFIGISYYRLLQVDFDGTSEYSEVISNIYDPILRGFDVHLFPNPTLLNHINLSVTTSNLTQPLEVIMTDLTGKIVNTVLFEVSASIATYTTGNMDLPPGVYFLQVKQLGGGTMMKRMIVE